VPCFVWESSEGRVVHALDRALLVIGRDPVSDIIVLEPAVSRRHALVQVDGERVTITDLGSSSGTKINGARLTPDLPSTLESGDFMQLGRVLMTYYQGEPPAAPLALDPDSPPAPPRQKGPRPPRVPRTPPRSNAPKAIATSGTGGPPWKWIALAAAFLMVGMAGALIAVLATRGGEGGEQTATQPPAPTVGKPEPEPEAPPPIQEPEPEPELPVDANRAPDGELPAQGFLSVADFPDLLELNGESYYPVKIVTWDGSRVQAVGADGRTYSIRQSEVTKSEDRVDLARRAARARQQLDPDDADAVREFARWCARRYIKREARLLATRLLELRPADPEATALLRSTE
jgi:hypothetical protein